MPDTSTRDWDASSYDNVSAPQQEMGREVLARLPLRGDETVLDAGCGSGRVTQMLVARLPRGRAVAVDGSTSMVRAARKNLGPQVEVRQSDLLALRLDSPVDAIFSTATFHWIKDHRLLFKRLYAALRPGGRLVAQCGGEGNTGAVKAEIENVVASPPFAEHLAGIEGPWNFASPAAARADLQAAGFTEIEAWLQPWPVRRPDAHEYLRTVMLGWHLERLPASLQAPFVDAVAERAGSPLLIDYVRLNLSARRPAAA